MSFHELILQIATTRSTLGTTEIYDMEI